MTASPSYRAVLASIALVASLAVAAVGAAFSPELSGDLLPSADDVVVVAGASWH